MRPKRLRLFVGLAVVLLTGSTITACAVSIPAGIVGAIMALLLATGLLFLGATQSGCDIVGPCLQPPCLSQAFDGGSDPDGGDPSPDGGGDPIFGPCLSIAPGDPSGHLIGQPRDETRLASSSNGQRTVEQERARMIDRLADELPPDVRARLKADEPPDESA